MRQALLVFFLMSAVLFVFLVLQEMHLLASLILFSQMALFLLLAQTTNFHQLQGQSRQSMRTFLFVIFSVLFFFLFEGVYQWPRSFNWNQVNDLFVAGGGEWLLMLSVIVALISTVGRLVLRKSQ